MVTELQILTDGFTTRGEKSVTVRWSDLAEIVAYKRDLLTTDMICIGFRLRGCSDIIEADEEMLGFDKLTTEITTRYSLREDWWRKVAHPAFATNETTIWSSTS